MKKLALLFALLFVACASSSRNPLQQLAWVKGDWIGSGGGYDAFYERYTIAKDGSIVMEFFDDAAFTKRNGSGTIKLEEGKVRYRSGRAMWEASSITKDEVCFAPKEGATNSFCWRRHSKDAWRATLDYPAPRKRTVVYELKRRL